MSFKDKGVIHLREVDGVFQEDLVEFNTDDIVFVYGFTHKGMDYLANTLVKDPADLTKCVEYIKISLLNTLRSLKLVGEAEEVGNN